VHNNFTGALRVSGSRHSTVVPSVTSEVLKSVPPAPLHRSLSKSLAWEAPQWGNTLLVHLQTYFFFWKAEETPTPHVLRGTSSAEHRRNLPVFGW